MDRFGVGAVLALVVLVALAQAFPQQPIKSSGEKVGLGTAYDEIVVETQLAVRPKIPSAGLRIGRAKAVFFRPNVTASTTSTSRTTTSSTSSSSTPSDGPSIAARVVGVENPLATAAARARSARQSESKKCDTPAGFSSSSSSYSYKSSSSSSSKRSHSEPAGVSPVVPAEAPALPVVPVFAAAPGETSSSSSMSSSSRSYTQHLPSGHVRTVSEEDKYSFAQGPHGKPITSRIHNVFVSDN